jgi:hypothetical protein
MGGGDISSQATALAAAVEVGNWSAATARDADRGATREWLPYVWSSIPGFVLATAAGLGLVSESVALPLFAISFVGLNLMHMGATWTRVYVRPGWRTDPMERLAVPVGLAAFALLFEAVGGGAFLLAAQYFLSFHHALMQNYGLVRASQRRDGRSIDTRLDLAACLLLPGAALLYRAGAVCDRYSGALLPSAPPAVVNGMAIAGALALAAFIHREWRSHREGERVDPIGLGMFCGTNLIWSAMLVTNPDPALPLYALASGHYAQYLHFVWHVERRDAPAGGGAPWRVRLLAEARRSPSRYLLVLLGIAGTATLLLTIVSSGLRAAAATAGLRPDTALAMPAWAAAMIGVNLEHYWLDRRIWRTRKRALAIA